MPREEGRLMQITDRGKWDVRQMQIVDNCAVYLRLVVNDFVLLNVRPGINQIQYLD